MGVDASVRPVEQYRGDVDRLGSIVRGPNLSASSASQVSPAQASRLNARLVRGWPTRILLVLAGDFGAFFLRELLARQHPSFAPFITFYPVVLLAALMDGVWAGILVTVLASFLAEYWIFPPAGSLAVGDSSDVLSIAIFFLFGVSLSIVIEMYHRSRERLALYELSAAAKASERARRESERLAFQREQLQALAERLRKAREEERTSVARDLHDQIGQILTAIKMDLIWIGRREVQPETQERLRAAIDLVNEGVHSVRDLCSGLRPSILDDLGLIAAIEWQAGEFTARTGIPCEVSAPSFALALDDDQTTAFFRIFQECLTNITRHAEATRVCVSLACDENELVMRVEDNGRGFDERAARESLGVLGMKERAKACGGDLLVISAPGAGATIVLRVALHADQLTGQAHAHSHC